MERYIPEPDLNDVKHAVQRGCALLHRLGLTGVHAPDPLRYLEAYQELAEAGEMGLRVLAMVPLAELAEAAAHGWRTGVGNELVRIGPVKILADGALGSQSALMFAPYEGSTDNYGIGVVWGKELADAIHRSLSAGFSVAVHAIGDKANHEVLNLLAAAAAESRRRKFRPRLEHAQLLQPADIPRFGALGVVASVQPLHCPSDRYMADQYWGGRCRGAYAFASLLAGGAVLAFGSDAPVEDPDPRLGIHAAVTRQRADEPDSQPWYGHECLPVVAALYAYTMGPAIAAGEADIKGSLTPGKLADITVFAEDLTVIPPKDIPEVPVAATLIGGRFMYRAF